MLLESRAQFEDWQDIQNPAPSKYRHTSWLSFSFFFFSFEQLHFPLFPSHVFLSESLYCYSLSLSFRCQYLLFLYICLNDPLESDFHCPSLSLPLSFLCVYVPFPPDKDSAVQEFLSHWKLDCVSNAWLKRPFIIQCIQQSHYFIFKYLVSCLPSWLYYSL